MYTIAPHFIDEMVDRVEKWVKYSKRGRKTFFWLDTLCIPVAEELSGYRRKAIDSMAPIYAGAKKVLVLDPDLQQIQSSPSNDLLTTHICSSPWMTRSWPLQEGALARNLFFRFEDRSILLNETQREATGLPELHLLKAESESMSSEKRFLQMWNALATRSTTKLKDLQAVFAALLDLIAGEILSLPEPERLKAILKSQDKIPLAVLYEHQLSDTGDTKQDSSWTPQFPGSHIASGLMDTDYGMLKITDEGFLVRLGKSFFLLVDDDLPTTDSFTLSPMGEDASYEIHLTSGECFSRRRVARSARMLILSQRRAVGGEYFQGAQFRVKSMDDEGLTLVFEHCFTWHNTEADLLHGSDISCKYFEVPVRHVMNDANNDRTDSPYASLFPRNPTLYKVLISEGKLSHS
jgi:hypothetical protein